MNYKKKLIEVALPLQVISAEGAREKTGGRLGHPSELHLWWSRKPLTTARAVLWASLVDDPSAHTDWFPTEEDQKLERKRLFGILERLAVWENSNDSEVLAEARAEIKKSCERGLPNVLDPFCGGGAIPLEAQRLGLPSFGGDLNPVAVLISKAMVEIPPRFASLPAVNPETQSGSSLKTWQRAQGLAEDIGYYGRWMRDRAFERIGHLYPKAALPAEQGGGEATVIAWLWVRTVRSPDPSWGGHVPLVSSWVLRKARKNKPVVWVDPVVDRPMRTVSYRVREGGGPPEGTLGRTAALCVATGTPIPRDYIKQEALEGRLSAQLVAIVAEGRPGRKYLDPVVIPEVVRPEAAPSASLSTNSQYMGAPLYGMDTTDSLFTDRQLTALSTFSELAREARPVVEEHARAAGIADDGLRLRDGGYGAAAYADAVVTYLAFVVDRCADKWSSLVDWQPGGEKVGHVFSRQAIPMVWDYAEVNPFSSSTANWGGILNRVSKAVAGLPSIGTGIIRQRDARERLEEVDLPKPMICTDPPYYDNVPYADISDFFYVWLRHNIAEIWPEETATILTPKTEELIANPHRAGSKDAARALFEGGMAAVLERVAACQHPDFPATIFYAFKQQETKAGGTVSTGWETFLQGLVDAGLQVTATWPLRTEKKSRMRAMSSVALATSVVIACRPRQAEAPTATLQEFRNALHSELSKSVRLLQDQAIAPVDMAQSAIGPGMEVFSRYARVLRADGTKLRVRDALVIINEMLEGVLSEEEAEFDADTRWALTWYEQFGHEPGPSGEAIVLSQAKNTSVDGVVKAGIAESQAGKVWLRHWEVFDLDWIPAHDDRLTDWEVAQYLMVRLEYSESTAADLLRQVSGATADRARRLVYLLYQAADRRGRTADAVAYNSLIRAWFDIARQAAADHRGTAMTLEGT